MAECLAIFFSKKGLKNYSTLQQLNGSFFDKRRAVQLTVFDDEDGDDLVDVLVGVDLLEVDDEDDDDRGVAIPGQVDGVCRYPL